jgi:hypothetical protein
MSLSNANEIVKFYLANDVKIPDVANHFGIKPAHVSAILALQGVKVRRGAGNLTAEARAAGAAKRTDKATLRKVRALVDSVGADRLKELIDQVTSEEKSA